MKWIIRKKHVGRSIDLAFEQGHTDPEDRIQVVNGRIENVRNRIASVRYWLPSSPRQEGWMTYIDTDDPRILTIY